ncbi:type 2 lanthipeptide synthetase LanM family protein [Rhizohabitans arisaemae]|uniref:type 2 lanthipeptide synthetase LanM family protein n=1 Tax=Rhizohabitans arisaemae TaxID=2720610 RepID=UPI0024B25372|nr:type 2 lanthipeptide synthetase LanM family protein [Rhizohabitans arisaemae]
MAGEFDPPLGPLVDPALTALATGLDTIEDLGVAERRAFFDGAAESLETTVRLKVNRVLLLELNAARITRRLTADDPEARWREWSAQLVEPAFWHSLTEHYPTLLSRLDALVTARCGAAVTAARRFAEDRDALEVLLPGPCGGLTAVGFGEGDTHRGGDSVAILTFEAGRVVYKPRSLAVDAELAALLPRLLPGEPAATRIRVPAVVVRDGYGWAEFVQHRYCADDAELRRFYRGVGQWAALMRLLGGSDLHAENLIAVGPVPTVVDCETLFTPHVASPPSGYGLAIDRAAEQVGGSVMRTGLLPGRGVALGWRGVDTSALGSLPGEQPVAETPVVVGAGTDEARMGVEHTEVRLSQNHPSREPVLRAYWDRVIDGYTEMNDRLNALDAAGELAGEFSGFTDRPIRVVLRGTETYAELARMLWHPVSLHDQPAAVRRAADLLAKHAGNMGGVPDDPEVIAAEIGDLLVGDIPFFATTPRRGRMDGPGGTAWGAELNLVEHALDRWRGRDQDLDLRVMRSALVSAYINEGWLPDGEAMIPARIRTGDLDPVRRGLAAGILRRLRDSAIHAEDGTVTWIAPMLDPTGWSVQPLSQDLYSGASGVAVLLGAYLTEVERGRADEVPGLEPLLHAVLHSIRTVEVQMEKDRRTTFKIRPEPPGGYIGLGSRIWTLLLLNRLGIKNGDALAQAGELAALIPEAVAEDTVLDILIGAAGAIVPLIRLAEHSGDDRWLAEALRIGERLAGGVTARERGVCWETPKFPEGLGGVAHGASGIGWTLARLAAVTGRADLRETAYAAFDYEESLYHPELAGWRDLRGFMDVAAAWCHGSGGIGAVAAGMLGDGQDARHLDVLARAAESCWTYGMGWSHTICHGDLGAWETIDLALRAGVGPPGLDRERLDARVLSGIEEFGPVSGLAREAFVPGMFPGLGGVAYQLLRMHPECTLPSLLLPDPGEAVPL